MGLQESVWRESWMTEEECQRMRRFAASIRRLFKTKGVQETPLLALRVIDVGIHSLLARRLERVLEPSVKENGEVSLDISGPQADHIGKIRERLRKAIRELEDACTRLGSPIDVGIADQLLPLVRETQQLLQSNPSASEFLDNPTR
ncbi:MAG: hypothetical protein KAH38_07115 [Candidatus Hydrogenedentes bacterium]|nr:hypothetical protein [Candidatus Hydrogenedentota bacterium]